MTNINNFVGPGVPFYGTEHVEAVATNTGKTAPVLSENASNHAGAGPAWVGQETGAGQAPGLSGFRNTDDGVGRKKRGVEQPDTMGARAVADAWLAKEFARVSANYVVQPSSHFPDVLVPPESTLGRWRTLLDDAFKGPGFLAWAKEQGLYINSFTLHPDTGKLTALVGDKRHTFSLNDSSGWSDVSRDLLSIAKIIESRPRQAIYYPWPEGKVPMLKVSNFYNQPEHLTRAQAELQLKQLNEGASFSFEPMIHASQRSPESLAAQKTALGDAANNHAVITALESQINDTNTHALIAALESKSHDTDWRELLGALKLHDGGTDMSAPISDLRLQVNSSDRSEIIAALKLQANDADIQALITVLAFNTNPANARALLTALKLPVNGAGIYALTMAVKSKGNSADLRNDLSKVMVPLDPHSTVSLSDDQLQGEMSVADILEGYDVLVPKTAKEAQNLADRLSLDLAHHAPQVNKGGVMPLTRRSEPGTLSAKNLAALGQIVEQWKAQPAAATLKASGQHVPDSLLGRLIGSLPAHIRNKIKDNPADVLDSVIRSPEAKERGQEIQMKLGGIETPTSAIEYASAALALDLDYAAGGMRHNLMGYDPYGRENVGASPAEIIQRFIRHLESCVGADIAPVAARLLLSISAPEFLVKDIPSSLVYGSHSWATFSIEALRIEKQVPGAVANMAYSQVMLFGETLPISDVGERQLKEIWRHPVIDWAVANGVISAREDGDYPAQDYDLSVRALQKQRKELAWSTQVLAQPMPTRKEMALAALRKVFGEKIDFEKPVLKDNRESWPTNFSYSLLDVYMSGELNIAVWESEDESALPFDTMRKSFHLLTPDINSAFDTAFAKYRAVKQAAVNATFRYHLSLMPVAEREVLDNSDISFYSVRKTYDGERYVQKDGHEMLVPNGKPSPQEVAALTGHEGVLIQADSGNGMINYYSYFPLQHKIVKEHGLSTPLISRPQKPWVSPSPNRPNDRGDVLRFDDNPYHGAPPKALARSRVLVERLAPPDTDRAGARVPSENAGKLSGVFFSKRNDQLGKTVSGHFLPDFETEKRVAKGGTVREQERATNRKLDEFFLSLAPFHDGIKAAIDGNVSGAVLELGLDILGFLLPASGQGYKALKGGRRIFKAFASGAAKGVASSFGIDDFLSAPKNIKDGLKAVGEKLDKLTSTVPDVFSKSAKAFDAQKVYKSHDVVRNFYVKATGNQGEMSAVTAIFLNGGWYAYNTLTKTPYGVQLVQYGLAEAAAR